jgi:Glycosyl transferase family 2
MQQGVERLWPVPDPLFSIVVTTYDRAQIVQRCIDSCLAQSLADFEVVVVDDGSTDGTAEALGRYEDPRIRIVAHDRNQGINPSRHTGVVNARGEWIVVVDSDDELVPHALERLREIIENLPQGVKVVRSRLVRDDGSITPAFVPGEPYGYIGRIRWAESEGGQDAGRCLHRSVFDASPYISNRRGAMETLFELNLAESATSVCVEDVLGKVHDDAPNSWLRSASAEEFLPRLFDEAPDMLWMAETTLERHGEALRRNGPRQYRTILRVAGTQAFLLGQRRKGAEYVLRALRARKLDPMAWATLALGMLGPAALARGMLAFKRVNARRAVASSCVGRRRRRLREALG